jgi:tetratricopeptide (TPR) repeat protein
MSHYYTGIISSYSSTFAIIAGNTEGYREKGIGEIFLAVSKGKYVSDEAKVILSTSILTQEFGEDYIPAFNILTWKSEEGYAAESREIEGDYLAALPLIKELTGKYPQNHFFKLQLAECYMNLNKHDLALQTIEQLMQSETLKKNKYLINRLYYIQGRIYAKLNEFEKAITAFKKALGVIQIKVRSLYYMGVVYEMMGEVIKAHESYNKIEKSQGRLGIIYLRAKARIENPYTPSQIEFYKGTNYIACGKYTEAVEIFNKLLGVELNKEKPDSAFIANLHFNISRVE